jgi:hypothetical protein
MNIWRPLVDPAAGYLFSLSDSLGIAESEHPGLLVPVANAAMIVASDYSGRHKGASHEAYSFLVTTDEVLREWLPSLGAFRKRWLPDNRRMSFKRLNEPVRWRVLPAFLETASKLSGNLITILVDRRVGSFISGAPGAAIAAFPDCFHPHANRGTVEKMVRLASFVALILSRLRREDQVSNWISDHDEAILWQAIVANWGGLEEHREPACAFGWRLAGHGPKCSEARAAAVGAGLRQRCQGVRPGLCGPFMKVPLQRNGMVCYEACRCIRS